MNVYINSTYLVHDERFIRETTELYYIPLLLAVLYGILIFYVLRGAK